LTFYFVVNVMLAYSYTLIAIIATQTQTQKVHGSYQSACSVNDPVFTIPILFDGVEKDFTLYSFQDVDEALVSFAINDDRVTREVHSRVADEVRKEVLLRGKLPYGRTFLMLCDSDPSVLDALKSPAYNYEVLYLCEVEDSLTGLTELDKHRIYAIVPSASAQMSIFHQQKENGVDVDIFLQYARIKYAKSGNFSEPLVASTRSDIILFDDVTLRENIGQVPIFNIFANSEVEVPAPPPPPPPSPSHPQNSITILLVDHDDANDLTMNVFRDVICVLTDALRLMDFSVELLRCKFLSTGECTKDKLAEREKIIVIAPHQLLRLVVIDEEDKTETPLILKVSERSERALMKTSILANNPAKWLQTATSTT